MLGAQKMQQRSHINAKTQHTHNVEKNTKKSHYGVPKTKLHACRRNFNK